MGETPCSVHSIKGLCRKKGVIRASICAGRFVIVVVVGVVVVVVVVGEGEGGRAAVVAVVAVVVIVVESARKNQPTMHMPLASISSSTALVSSP